MEYYLVITKSELCDVNYEKREWISENIMLSDGSLTPKCTHCMKLFISNSSTGNTSKAHTDREQISGCLKQGLRGS